MMDLHRTPIYVASVCALGFAYLWWTTRRPARFPPGPTIIPVFGSLPFMKGFGKEMLGFTLQRMADRYGPIYSLVIGNNWTVVICGYDRIRKALVNYSVEFAGRPSNPHRDQIKGNPHHIGIADQTYTNEWKAQRNVVMVILRALGYGRHSTEQKIRAECLSLIQEFKKQGHAPFKPKHVLDISVTNVICFLLFNEHYGYEDKQITHLIFMLRQLFTLRFQDQGGDFIPILRLLPKYRANIKQYKRLMDELRVYVEGKIQDRKNAMTSMDEEPKDLIQFYLQELHKSELGDSKISEDWLERIIMEIYMAGTDTISTTLHWALLLMIAYPDVQCKVHKEIDEVLGEPGNSRNVNLSDRSAMPYIEATIMEIQRFVSLAPLPLPHSTTCDVEFEGFHIPKDTTILFNLWETTRDPSLWNDPETFDPQRFLDDNGENVHPEYWIPFSIGRRSCLGEQLARQELFMFFVSMLQAFNFSPPEDTVPDLEPDVSQIMRKPQDYQLCIETRV